MNQKMMIQMMMLMKRSNKQHEAYQMKEELCETNVIVQKLPYVVKQVTDRKSVV